MERSETAMSLAAFTAPGRFFRGNLHTHSNRSDGALPPAEVCRLYRERGYDFLCISDHFLERYGFPITDTRDFRTGAFTTIIGAEVHAPATELGENWHILANGLPFDFAPTREGETGPELAERCLAAGAFVTIAHPEWYGLTMADAASIAGAHAVEVYNHTSAVREARGGGTYFLDALLVGGRRINALATDDAHFGIEGDAGRDAFGGWVMVKAEQNSEAALLTALKAGHYYSTQGPTIENIALEGEEIAIACSPAAQVVVLGRASRHAYAIGFGLTTARLPLTRFAGDWCRVVVTDADGRHAWSNPIYL
jgi:hypothetical protein